MDTVCSWAANGMVAITSRTQSHCTLIGNSPPAQAYLGYTV
jgi:hypothetical protein